MFVSQMSNSVLVRIPVDGNGFLVDNHDAWMVGELNEEGKKGISGMHNISLSTAHPGCLWISLQCAILFMSTTLPLIALTLSRMTSDRPCVMARATHTMCT